MLPSVGYMIVRMFLTNKMEQAWQRVGKETGLPAKFNVCVVCLQLLDVT